VQRTVTQLTCGINVCSACNQRVKLFGKASHRRDMDWEVSEIPRLIHVLEHELAELRQVLFHIPFQYIRSGPSPEATTPSARLGVPELEECDLIYLRALISRRYLPAVTSGGVFSASANRADHGMREPLL
jgi:hypothetical protein